MYKSLENIAIPYYWLVGIGMIYCQVEKVIFWLICMLNFNEKQPGILCL